MSRHEGVNCDSCFKSNFRIRRFKCLICFNYDLCGSCYDKSCETGNHKQNHPMQCILTRTDYPLFYDSENVNDSIPCAFTCPHCGENGFSSDTLCTHVTQSCKAGLFSRKVLCPICAGSQFGHQPNRQTTDLAAHLLKEHSSKSKSGSAKKENILCHGRQAFGNANQNAAVMESLARSKAVRGRGLCRERSIRGSSNHHGHLPYPRTRFWYQSNPIESAPANKEAKDSPTVHPSEEEHEVVELYDEEEDDEDTDELENFDIEFTMEDFFTQSAMTDSSPAHKLGLLLRTPPGMREGGELDHVFLPMNSERLQRLMASGQFESTWLRQLLHLQEAHPIAETVDSRNQHLFEPSMEELQEPTDDKEAQFHRNFSETIKKFQNTVLESLKNENLSEESVMDEYAEASVLWDTAQTGRQRSRSLAMFREFVMTVLFASGDHFLERDAFFSN